MRNNLETLVITAIALLAILFVCSMAMYSGNGNRPTDLNPGDTVASLVGKSVIENGNICQQYRSGFVNTFGPDGEEYWFKPERFLFPTAKVISVIHENGTYEWVRYTKIVKTPATSEDMLCLSPISE